MRRGTPLAAAGLLLGGCEARFGDPASLWLLWLAAGAALFELYDLRARRRLLRRIVSTDLLRHLAAGVSRRRQAAKAALVVLGLAALLVAYARPRWGFTWEDVQRRGLDIVVALDVSDSMLVRDGGTGPSRLEQAKREVVDLLRGLEGDRIGLVAFAGSAHLHCPLTLDYGAAELFLSTLSPDAVAVKGTDLGAAVSEALRAFEGGARASRAVLLLTDGEDHGGQGLAAAERAAAEGVPLFVLGVGRAEGTPVPRAGGGFRRDREGEIVLSRLDEPALQAMASITGGRYARSTSGDLDLEAVYRDGIKATLEDRELESKRRRRWEERFQWVLGLALAALMLEPLLGERRRERGSRWAWRRAAGAALVAILAGAATPPARGAPEGREGSPGAARDPSAAYAAGDHAAALAGFLERQAARPDDPALALGAGSSQYRLGRYDDAALSFGRAARVASDPRLRAAALYDGGNAAYRRGRLDEALERYQEALELAPDDEDARFNLDLVRREMARRRQEPERQPQEGSGDSGGDPRGSGEERPDPGRDPSRAAQAAGDEPPQPAPGGSQPGDEAPSEGAPQGGSAAAGGEGVAASPGNEGSPATGADPAGRGLTAEEAERYLRALVEGVPRHPPEAGERRVMAGGKDW